MMHESPLKPKTRRTDDRPWILVESKAFVEFDRWMDVQLDRVVDRWVSEAAPKAKRAEQWQHRFSR